MPITKLAGALLMTVLVVCIAGDTAVAQETARPEGRPEGADRETRPAAEFPCPPQQPLVILHDTNDGFAPPGTPATLSPALNAWLVAPRTPRRGYDQAGLNMHFGDSMRIRPCKVCRAQLEIRVKRASSTSAANDALHVGGAPFNTAVLKVASPVPLWQSTGLTDRVLTVPLPAAALNNYIFNGPPGTSLLDVYVQDDSNVDYAKLTVWYW